MADRDIPPYSWLSSGPTRGPYPPLEFGGGFMHDLGQALEAAGRSAMPLEQQFSLRGAQSDYERQALADAVRQEMLRRQLAQDDQRIQIEQARAREEGRHNLAMEGQRETPKLELTPSGDAY